MSIFMYLFPWAVLLVLCAFEEKTQAISAVPALAVALVVVALIWLGALLRGV